MKTSPRLAILSLITASATTENAEAVTVRKLIQKKQHKLMTIKKYKAEEIQNIKYTDLALHKYPGVHEIMHMTPTNGFHMF